MCVHLSIYYISIRYVWINLRHRLSCRCLRQKKKIIIRKCTLTRMFPLVYYIPAHNSNRHVSEFDGTISLMDLGGKKKSRHRVLGDQAESSISYNNNNMRARSLNSDRYSVLLWLLSACTYILTVVIFSHTRARDNYARTVAYFSTAKWAIPPYAIKISETDLNTILFIIYYEYALLQSRHIETSLQTFCRFIFYESD